MIKGQAKPLKEEKKQEEAIRKAPLAQSKPVVVAESKLKKKGKYRREIDTNVFQISMSCLNDQAELATGDPVFCQKC